MNKKGERAKCEWIVKIKVFLSPEEASSHFSEEKLFPKSRSYSSLSIGSLNVSGDKKLLSTPASYSLLCMASACASICSLAIACSSASMSSISCTSTGIDGGSGALRFLLAPATDTFGQLTLDLRFLLRGVRWMASEEMVRSLTWLWHSKERSGSILVVGEEDWVVGMESRASLNTDAS